MAWELPQKSRKKHDQGKAADQPGGMEGAEIARAADGRLHLRTLFADDPQRGERMTAEARGFFWITRRIGSRTRRCGSCCAGGRVGATRAHRGDVQRREDQHHGKAGRAARGAAGAEGRAIVVDGEDVVPEVHEVLDKMAAFCRARAQRRMEGAYGQADSQRGEHRDWRVRSGAGDGV